MRFGRSKFSFPIFPTFCYKVVILFLNSLWLCVTLGSKTYIKSFKSMIRMAIQKRFINQVRARSQKNMDPASSIRH